MKKRFLLYICLFVSLLILTGCPSLFSLGQPNIDDKYEVVVINTENFICHNHLYKNKVLKSFKEKTLHNKTVFRSTLTIFYPEKKEKSPLVIIGHGWGDGKKSNMSLARYLAGQGYITVIFSAKHRDYPEQFLIAFEEAYKIIQNASENPSSRLFKKIDLNKTSIIGHSMGGTAALHFAKGNKKIHTVIALNPYNGASKTIELVGGKNEILGTDLSAMTIPLLIFTGEKDEIAFPEKTFEFCKNINQDIPFAFFSIKDGKHVHPMDKIGNTVSGSFNEQKHDIYRRIIVSWLDMFLKGDKNAAEQLYLNDENFNKIKPLFKSKENLYPPYLLCNF